MLCPFLPPVKPGDRPRSIDLRRLLNGLFSLVRTGCAWRYLPREYGPWSTVDHSFRPFRRDGTWEQLDARLGELVRVRAGRESTPHAAIIDSQSVKTHQGRPRGCDGAKQVSGRKRHVLVDTLGLLLKVVVHPAHLHARLGAKLVLGALGSAFPRRQHIWADQGYAGALRQWTRGTWALRCTSYIPGRVSSNVTSPTCSMRWAVTLGFMCCRGAGCSSVHTPGWVAHGV